MFPDDQAAAATERERDRAQRETMKLKKAFQKYKEAVQGNTLFVSPTRTLMWASRNLW